MNLLLIVCFGALQLQQIAATRSSPQLETFVSRPDIRPLKFEINSYDPSLLSPGYWFVSFYNDILDPAFDSRRMLQTPQVGPHIYDNSGNLVWSGVSLFPRRIISDFRANPSNNETRLSFLLCRAPHNFEIWPVLPDSDIISNQYPEGIAVILNSTYQVERTLPFVSESRQFDMHEFHTVQNGRSAIFVTHRSGFSLDTSCLREGYCGRIVSCDFMEVDLESNRITFQWTTEGRIALSESVDPPPDGWGSPDVDWDYLHMNSADKDENGDYLVSIRDTNAIYKISHVDGSIIWRLGGKQSDFHLRDFNFSAQHDARFISANKTHTVISFFNNASNGTEKPTAAYSTAMMVVLDTSPSVMTATVLQRWDRPDHALTEIRGNLQILPNKNAFVCWSKNAYLSEFTGDGKCIMEAKLPARGFATYRAYKSNFTGMPETRPALKVIAYGTSCHQMNTVAYISWNGATRVASWNFYVPGHSSSHEQRLVGTAPRVGFETVFVITGLEQSIFGEAIDIDGRSLGNSSIEMATSPTSTDLIRCDAGLQFKHDDSTNSPGRQWVSEAFRSSVARVAKQLVL